MSDPFNISRMSLKGHSRYLFSTWIFHHSSQVSYTKFRVDPMQFLEQNKKSFYQTIFSCYVLILSIHMNPQTRVSIFKYFRSKGQYLYSNEKKKRKNLFFCKNLKFWRSLGNSQLFLVHEKEKKEKREETFSCVTFEMMKVFGKIKKGKKPFQGKIRSCKGHMETPIFLLQSPI